MKTHTAFTILATALSLVSASAVNYDSGIIKRDIEMEKLANIIARDLNYDDLVSKVVDAIVVKRDFDDRIGAALAARQAPPPAGAPGVPTAPNIVKSVLAGIAQPIQENKINVNGGVQTLLAGTQNLFVKSFNFNQAVPAGVSTGIDGNTQLQNLPFGSVIGSGVKAVVGGVDWNALINRDLFNGVQKGATNVNFNDVLVNGLNQIAGAF
ncbi:hypothetical protein HIM_08357 [Hirsutella minnesotensis 3608]|uniref:Uncharacterized protein n=1 Tax=Hirsutella minnesotensis 3608 TaxID=1043627 RepID=A0A0F7ZML6_9HYPO|nr:hypothetical protein HIM_08357 [Hirsutella minnesotensis 3608]